MKLKKRITIFLIVLVLFSAPPITIWTPVSNAEPAPADLSFPLVTSQAAALMEFSGEKIIFSQNGDVRKPPASLTKIMTLLLAFEALEEGRVSLEEEVTISENAWETGGSQMFLNIGQKVAYGDLLKGIAIVSANDACVALAEHLCGLEASFAQEMNKKAAELGLLNTQFENASGLPQADHYSSAEDMAKLAVYLLKTYPQVLDLYSQREFTFNNITQPNRNPLLDRYPGADGLKTGHTNEAGYCLAGTAVQNGMRFIAVIFNAPSESVRRTESEALLNYAFRHYSLEEIFSAGETIAVIEVAKGEKKETYLQTIKDLQVVIPYNRKDDLKINIIVPDNITSPILRGTQAGEIEIALDGAVILKEPLYTSEDVAKAGRLALLWRSIKEFFSNLWQLIAEKVTNILP